MAMRHGKAGSLTWTSETQANISSWSFDYTVSLTETTAMDSAGDYKDYLAGFTDWTATVEIRVDSTNVLMGTSTVLGEIGDSGVLVFSDGTNTYTATGIATDCALAVDKEEVVVATYSFEGNSKFVVG